jgi:hypothetical protein
MNHDEFLLGIDEYLDGDLPPEEEAAMEAHLADCGECRGEIQTYRRLRRLAFASEPVPIPDDLGYRIRRRLEEVPGFRRPRGRLLRLSTLLPGVAAAAILLLLLLPRPEAPSPRPAGVPIGDAMLARAPARPDVDRTLADWLLLAENADEGDLDLLAREAAELDLLPRVRDALAAARGERRRWLRAGEDLLLQLENGAPGEYFGEEARLVAEVTR